MQEGRLWPEVAAQRFGNSSVADDLTFESAWEITCQ